MRLFEELDLQHRGAEVQRPPRQSARLLQGARRAARRHAREDAEHREQGRRQAEARRAEPQPDQLRRRRLAVRGLLRPAVVPDGELPRPRREPDGVAAERLARAELHARLHRAVPVRSQHHRRRQPLPERQSATSASSRSDTQGGVLTFGFPLGRGFTRMFTNYSYERVQRHRDQRGLSGPRGARARTRSCATRCCSARRQPAASASSARSRRRSSTTRSTIRSFRRPASGCTASIDFAGLGGNTSFIKPMLEGVYFWRQNRKMSLGVRGAVRVRQARATAGSSCRFSSGCSSAASTRCAASTSGRSVRPIRSPASCSAATRACSSTSSRSSRLPARCGVILFFDAGQVRNFGERLRLDARRSSPAIRRRFRRSSIRSAPGRRPDRSRRVAAGAAHPGGERVQDVDGRRGPVLHAGPERAVPADFRLQPAARRRARQLAAAAEGFQFRFAVGTTF